MEVIHWSGSYCPLGFVAPKTIVLVLKVVTRPAWKKKKKEQIQNWIQALDQAVNRQEQLIKNDQKKFQRISNRILKAYKAYSSIDIGVMDTCMKNWCVITSMTHEVMIQHVFSVINMICISSTLNDAEPIYEH